MQVKEILETVKTWNLNEGLIWFLDEDKTVIGTIISWKYDYEGLKGQVQTFPIGLDDHVGTLRTFLKAVKEYNVPEDTELYLDAPGRELQPLSNCSYNNEIKRFSSEIHWEKTIQ